MKLNAIIFATALSAGCMVSGAWQAADAQGYATSNPNMNHFYMARQQITITDDAPVVDDRRTGGAPGAAGGAGAMPNRPVALPRAGWVPYSSSIPGLSTSLPKVNNGVPPKMPPPAPVQSGMKGKTGKLGASKSKPVAKTPQAPTVSTYTPYKGYGAPAQMTKKPAPALPAPGYGSSAQQTQTNVRGNVLHWARVKRKPAE